MRTNTDNVSVNKPFCVIHPPTLPAADRRRRHLARRREEKLFFAPILIGRVTFQFPDVGRVIKSKNLVKFNFTAFWKRSQYAGSAEIKKKRIRMKIEEHKVGQIRFAVRRCEKVVGSSPISFHVVPCVCVAM